MWKKIQANTILFVIILTFVKIFQVIFGTKNSLVGVTVIISILVLMQEDLTKKPVENFIKLFLLNLFLGIFAHISSHNMWMGLILNFVTLYGIGYLLSFNLTKVNIIPFGLQYLFMLYTPVIGMDYGKRILGLSFGAVLIMVVQLIIHRKNNNIKIEESELIESDKKEDIYRHIDVFGKIYKFHTVRGAYAIRIGLITAIVAFAVAFFNLQQGRWIVYTTFSLTELYSENCQIRSKQRLQGTIIGTLIIIALFMLIKNDTVRGLIVLVGGYLDTYTTNYRDKMICVTMSVVASVSLINGTIITAIERIVYVSIGIILVMIVDKLIFRNKSADLHVQTNLGA